MKKKKKKLFSTQEVADIDGCSKPVVLKWAREKGNVEMIGIDYVWTESDIKKFRSRNKQPGRRPAVNRKGE